MQITAKHKTTIRILSIILTAAIAAVIFLFSAQPGDASNETSMSFMSLFFSSDDIDLVFIVNWIIRKLAHMTEFAALAVAAWFFVSTFDIGSRAVKIISVAFAAVYAASDEIHQLFVEGRAGMFRDVVVDTVGAVLGVLIISKIVEAVLKRKSQKALNDGRDL